MQTKKMKKIVPLLALVVTVGLSGCSANLTTEALASTQTTGALTTAASAQTNASSTSTQTIKTLTADEEDSDASYNASTATKIVLSDNKITISSKGAAAKGSVVTVTEAGTYIISGSLKAGQIVVEADKEEKVHIILNGVTLSSNSGPALWVKTSEKVIITLAKGSTNTIKDSGNYTLATGEVEPDAAIFSSEDLSINGSGQLSVTGNYANGIKSKDMLLVMSGTLKITAKTHGLNGKDGVGIFGGNVGITSTEDGIHSSSQVFVKAGTVKITAGDDGIHADSVLQVNGGTIDVIKSSEGIESANITINSGVISIVASDDGINAAGGNDASALGGQPVEKKFSTAVDYFIKINGGTIKVNAKGDGLDANGSIYVNGGTTTVSGPTDNGNGAMDYDQNCVVTGGTLFIAGSSGMAQAPGTTSTQNSVLIYFTSTQPAGTMSSLVDSTGNTILSYAPAKAYQTVLFSSSKLIKGKTYSLVTGGKTLTKITLTEIVTKISDKGVAVTGGMGGPTGGAPGEGGRGQHGDKPLPNGTQPQIGSQPTTNTDATTSATNK